MGPMDRLVDFVEMRMRQLGHFPFADGSRIVPWDEGEVMWRGQVFLGVREVFRTSSWLRWAKDLEP